MVLRIEATVSDAATKQGLDAMATSGDCVFPRGMVHGENQCLRTFVSLRATGTELIYCTIVVLA
jgi:hypothetical protein